jgi:hypothetical protein
MKKHLIKFGRRILKALEEPVIPTKREIGFTLLYYNGNRVATDNQGIIFGDPDLFVSEIQMFERHDGGGWVCTSTHPWTALRR